MKVPAPPMQMAKIRKNKNNDELVNNKPAKPSKYGKCVMKRLLLMKKKKLLPSKHRNVKDPFPALACISDNVLFWEKVYSEIDVNEAYLHDKMILV